MSEGRTNNDDYISDCYVGAWEEQVIEEIENDSENITQRLHSETDLATKKLWASFQNAAQFVAVMYKGAADNHQHTLWVPFQTAAGSVTSLYKESLEYMRKSSELGIQAGHQKRNKEVANWARRKRHIRREELLAFLSGKTPPPSRNTHLRGSPRSRLSLERMSPRHPSSHQTHNTQFSDDDLSTFREALGIHAPVSSPNFSTRRRNSGHSPELQSFLCDEFARHKRPAPSASPTHDVTMDSPQHKRFKYT